MARLTTGFAWAVMLAVLAVGVSPGNGELWFPLPLDPNTKCLPPITQFPWNHLPVLYSVLSSLPPMRIISKGDPSLSVAVDESTNKTVLVKTNCTDPKQLWVQHYSVMNLRAADGGQYCGTVFALVNLANVFKTKPSTPLAMVFSDDTGASYDVKMETYDPSCVPVSMLWTLADPQPSDYGFYKIKSLRNGTWVLDGLWGRIHEGTVVGVYPANHDDDNIKWMIKGFLSYP
ncbi:hypothetical protein ACP70R_019236 [Stipagrostis hirtigluma subsp. patula]